MRRFPVFGRRTAAAGALAGAIAVLGPIAGAEATPLTGSGEQRQWAPIASATVHPGIMTETRGAACTANFVFTDRAGAVYLGQAAHCAGKGGTSVDADGCLAGSYPLGTKVDLMGSEVVGTLAYSSWLTMQAVSETDPAACVGNDFALIRIPPSALAAVNPSLPAIGGPASLGRGVMSAGDLVLGYGNSNLRGGLSALSLHQGVALGTSLNGWTHDVYVLPPGIPGDSGGGFVDAAGAARGVLITLNGVPPGSNSLTDLAKAIDYASEHAGFDGLELVPGTEPFSR